MGISKITAFAAAAVALAGSANADTYTYITYKPQGANDAHANSIQWLVDEFAKRTNGKHQIEVFWGGSVAAVGETPEAVANGVGDMGDIVTPYFPDLLPLNNAIGFYIPQPLDSQGVADAMVEWHASYPQFSEELAAQNLHAFSFRALEDYGLLCKQPVSSMADLKGKRIRSYGFAYPALIEAMGATPVSVTTSDTYEALERSIIDCTPIGPALARGFKYDEIAKYYIEFPFGASFGHLLTINLDTYNGMDDETREILDQLGKDYIVEYGRMLSEDQDKVRAAWKDELGVEVMPFPAEELVLLADDPKVQAVRKEWQAKAEAAGLPVADVVSRLQF